MHPYSFEPHYLSKMARIQYLLAIIHHLVLPPGSLSTPEKRDCEWVPDGQVTRIRDLQDCQSFYFCIKGKPPFRMSCPKNWQFHWYSLYFNPNTTNCDYSSGAPDECFGPPGTGEPGGYGVTQDYIKKTTTTTTTTTTLRPPRPPLLEEEDNFEIDCSRKRCGFFPNTYGPCDTYAVCVNGEKLIKKCNGGFVFDSITRECVPASKATCWTEPDAGPHVVKDPPKECPFHDFPESTPVESTLKGVTVLENPIVTTWGEYGNWTNCPRGSYANGINAWRRVIIGDQVTDHAGITALALYCRKPGVTLPARGPIIESVAPGSPAEEWPKDYFKCKGTVVGIRVNSVSKDGWGKDQLAADNVQAICSCSGPAYKPYENPEYAPQNGNRGTWTSPQYCKRGQAVCGMQTQMQEYKEDSLGTYDNTGLNNLRVKCCNVPDPSKTCLPEETKILVRECDNSKSDQTLRCQFQAQVGLTIEDSNAELVEFYSSIGYSYEEGKTAAAARIEKELVKVMRSGIMTTYHWDEMVPEMREADAAPVFKNMSINEFENVKLYQIVAKCEQYVLRTNRFIRSSNKGQSEFEI